LDTLIHEVIANPPTPATEHLNAYGFGQGICVSTMWI